MNLKGILCNFSTGRDKLIFGCVFRPPRSDINYLNCITNSLDNFCKNFPTNKLIIACDFNLPHIDWSAPNSTINNNLTNTFVQNILCNSFDQIVTMPTRENNIVDLVLCRNLDPLPYVNIIPPLIDTDHEFIQCCLPIYSINNKVTESIYNRNFQKANYFDMNEYIMNINWALELYRFTSVNDRYNVFLQSLYTAVDIFVPMKLNRKRSLKLHLPKHIKNLLNKKKFFWRKGKRYKTDYNKRVFNNISKVCSKALFDFNKEKVDKSSNSKNISGFYSYVTNKIGRMKAPVTLKDDNGTVLGEQDSINVFAEYFPPVNSKDNYFLQHFDKRSNVLLSKIKIDVVEVDRRLLTLPNKYSSGPDNIPNILLINCIPHLLYHQA